MLGVRCADLGNVCRGYVTARTEEELVQKVAEHARKRHGIQGINETLGAYAVSKAEGTPEPPEERR